MAVSILQGGSALPYVTPELIYQYIAGEVIANVSVDIKHNPDPASCF